MPSRIPSCLCSCFSDDNDDAGVLEEGMPPRTAPEVLVVWSAGAAGRGC